MKVKVGSHLEEIVIWAGGVPRTQGLEVEGFLRVCWSDSFSPKRKRYCPC